MFRTIIAMLLTTGLVNAQEAKKPLTTSFKSPVKGKEWKPESYGFGQDCSYETEQKGVMKRWGNHLGEDMTLDPGTVIVASGDGNFTVRFDIFTITISPRCSTMYC